MRRITVLLIALMVISVGFLSGCEQIDVKQDTGTLEIIKHKVYRHNDNVYVFGIVKNINANDMEYVKLVITLYDSGDNLIKSEVTYIHPNILESGKEGVFRKRFTDVPSYYDHYDVKLDSYSQFDSKPNTDVIITDIGHNTFGTLGYELYGTVKNTGSTDLSVYSIYAKFYSSSSELVYIGSDLIRNSDSGYDIPPGEEGEFSIYAYEHYLDPLIISDYDIILDN